VNNVNDQSSDQNSGGASVHERLGDLCINFHQLQDELLKQAGPGQGERMRELAAALIELSQQHLDQVLGELFLAEHANYNFSKPLYVGASLVELIRRYNQYSTDSVIDDDKREQLVLAAMGYNLGLLADERRVYENRPELSPAEKRELREHYPQQSAKILESAGLDQAVIQDVVQNHNLVSDNPSKDALLMRTPFIYAGIAIPQNLGSAQRSIDNPSREFARMFTNQELDTVYGGLYLKINGLAPIGSILNLESNEKVVVVKGPQDEDIASSTVRMLANRNGVQLLRPGEHYRLGQTPTRHRGLADHHHVAWTNFSPHSMWE
jgi:hypothetical protein